MQLEGMENVMQSVLSKIGKKNITLLQEQYQAISSVFSGQDTIVCIPTGRGKSIIFEAVPWCHVFANGNGDCRGIDSVVLIISPLLSLMTKQVGDLTGEAWSFCCAPVKRLIARNEGNCCEGRSDVHFCQPRDCTGFNYSIPWWLHFLAIK